MSTVFFANIEGKLVNVALITLVEWYEGYSSIDPDLPDETVIVKPCLNIWFAGEEDCMSFRDTPASRAAYEWLKSLAVDPVVFMESKAQS